MSTKERAYSLIDRLSENQLDAVVEFLTAFCEPQYEEVEPDEFELKMIADSKADDSEGEPIEDFAKRLGIDI